MSEGKHNGGDPVTPPDANQIKLVESSWEKLASNLDELASLFYQSLFELAPEIKPLFENTDMVQQGKKLTDTLTVAVKGLQFFPALVPALAELGNRHVAYGVKHEHYSAVRSALLTALNKVLGDSFDQQTAEAWKTTYDALAQVMKRGLRERPEPV